MPIVRSDGQTDSERYLARLADRTFLRLWSYPNVFVDDKPNGSGDGKELCDLLAISGDDVFVFSDKHIAWDETAATSVAWGRWYRRAIEKSANQLAGAERWLSDYPKRLFLDAACNVPFPVNVPLKPTLRVHKVAIAVGVKDAAQAALGGRGTLIVNPSVTGPSEHLRQLFTVGDVDPEKSFVHVFDETAFDILMRELDTVTDLRDYLIERARFIRSKNLAFAPGEEELLGYYLQAERGDGTHAFLGPDGREFGSNQLVAIDVGHFDRLMARPEYRRKKEANRESYVWDDLIERFVGSMLEGTLATPFGEAVGAVDAERGLRRMAQERRTDRRLQASAFVGALKIAEDRKLARVARVSLPGPTAIIRDLAYIFLIVAIEKDESYDDYRKRRALMLLAYCLNTLKNYPSLSRVVGIAVDASKVVTGQTGGSKDLIAMEGLQPTDPLFKKEEELKQLFNIRDISDREFSRMQVQEYPADPSDNVSGVSSRQQRRAMQRRARKDSRRGSI